MPYEKIEQVTESTLVLGVDIGSSEHYVRAFDYRGRELTRKVFRFSTDINGFNSFYDWVTQICIKHGKNEAMIGCEPTGHYWYTFYQFVKDHGMKLAFVNPASVKKAKELDDNSPKKTDLKDPKTIAKLVIDGRYSFPYVPEGIYAEIREVTSSRDRIMKELNAASNRIQRWLKIYFPEYLTVYKKFDTTTGMMILEKAPLPDMVKALGADHIVKIWRQQKVRGKGASLNRAKTLVDAAHDSVGKPGGQGAVMEIQGLKNKFYIYKFTSDLILILGVVFVPILIFSIILGIKSGFQNFKYPILANMDGITGFSFSRIKDFVNGTQHCISKNAMYNVGLTYYSTEMARNPYLDYTTLGIVIILTVVMFILLIGVYYQFTFMVSYLIKNAYIGLFISLFVIAGLYFLSPLGSLNMINIINPLTYRDPTMIITGTSSFPYSIGMIVLLICNVLLFVLNRKVFNENYYE